MRFYFDRHGQYRGYSTGLLFWIAAALIVGVLALSVGYQLFMLTPVLAIVGLAIWAWTWQIRRWRKNAAEKQAASR